MATLSKYNFLNHVQNLRNDVERLAAAVEDISRLHQRSLNDTDTEALNSVDRRTSQTQAECSSNQDGIEDLEHDASHTTDQTRAVKISQLQALKKQFRSELDRLVEVERSY